MSGDPDALLVGTGSDTSLMNQSVFKSGKFYSIAFEELKKNETWNFIFHINFIIINKKYFYLLLILQYLPLSDHIISFQLL